MVQALGYLLVPCRGPTVKSRVEGRVFCTDTPSQLVFAFSVLNNLDIDCVGGYFTHLLNLV